MASTKITQPEGELPVLYKLNGSDNTILLVGRQNNSSRSQPAFKITTTGVCYYGICTIDDDSLYTPLPVGTVLTITQ